MASKNTGSIGSGQAPSGPQYGNDQDYDWKGASPQREAAESNGGVVFTQPSRQPILTNYEHDDMEFAEPCTDPYDSPEQGNIGETPQRPLPPNDEVED